MLLEGGKKVLTAENYFLKQNRSFEGLRGP